jgi:LacI family transcriptional regulator
MKMFIHGKGTIAVIIAAPHDPHIHQRADGFRMVFRNHKLVTVKEFELFHLTEDVKAIPSLDEIFKDNTDLLGIFVTNGAAYCVAEYLRKRNLQKKIFLIGYDLAGQNLDYLNSDTIDFLISQKPGQQGYEGIYALYQHCILKENCPKKILMPIDIITKENLLYYQRE